MDDGSTLPVPFNMIPSPKSFIYLWKCARKLCNSNEDRKQDFERKIRKTFIKVGGAVVAYRCCLHVVMIDRVSYLVDGARRGLLIYLT